MYHGNRHNWWILSIFSIGLNFPYDKEFYILNKTQKVSIAAWKIM